MYKLSQLVNLEEISITIIKRDLDQYREMMLRQQQRNQQNQNPTANDLCAYILSGMTNIKRIDLDQSSLNQWERRRRESADAIYRVRCLRISLVKKSFF